MNHVQDYSLKISILSATHGGHCHNEEFSANITGEALTLPSPTLKNWHFPNEFYLLLD